MILPTRSSTATKIFSLALLVTGITISTMTAPTGAFARGAAGDRMEHCVNAFSNCMHKCHGSIDNCSAICIGVLDSCNASSGASVNARTNDNHDNPKSQGMMGHQGLGHLNSNGTNNGTNNSNGGKPRSSTGKIFHTK